MKIWIGSYPEQEPLWRIKQLNIDSLNRIVWNPPDYTRPVSEKGLKCLDWVEKNGNLSGYQRKKYKLNELVSNIISEAGEDR